MPPRIKTKEAPVPRQLNARGARVRDRLLQAAPEATKKRKDDAEVQGREVKKTKMFPNLGVDKNGGSTPARAKGIKTETPVPKKLTPGGAMVRDRLVQLAPGPSSTNKRKSDRGVQVKIEEDSGSTTARAKSIKIETAAAPRVPRRLNAGGEKVRARLSQATPGPSSTRKRKSDRGVQVKVEEDSESTPVVIGSKKLTPGGATVRARLVQAASETSTEKRKHDREPHPRERKKPEPRPQVDQDDGSMPAIILTPSGATARARLLQAASGPTSSSTSTNKRKHDQETQGREEKKRKMFPNLIVGQNTESEPARVRSKAKAAPGPSSSTSSTTSRDSTSGSHPGDEYKRLLETETPVSELQDYGNRVAEFWDGVLEEPSSP
ncbi:MAG: hypothetical protein Q9195_007714 [Heterodermia aff. obscurata]